MLESPFRTAVHERLVPEVPRKLPIPGPLNKLKDTAVDAVKDPKGTSERLVGQVKGAASVGRHLAEGLASQVTEQVGTRRRRRAGDAPRAASTTEAHSGPQAQPAAAPRKTQGDPVAPHPATDAPSAEPAPSRAPAATTPEKTPTPADVAKKATPRKTPAAKKSPTPKAAKKAPAKKTATKKAAATKTPAKKTAAKKAATGTASAPGDKLPPRSAPRSTPPPPPQQVEPNPEANPPR